MSLVTDRDCCAITRAHRPKDETLFWQLNLFFLHWVLPLSVSSVSSEPTKLRQLNINAHQILQAPITIFAKEYQFAIQEVKCLPTRTLSLDMNNP